MTKNEHRKQIAERKKNQSSHESKTASERLVQSILKWPLFQQAEHIGLYSPLPDEVDILPLLQAIQPTIYLPAFDAALDGYRMAKGSVETKKGKFGILEPVDPIWAGTNELDLILVPGIAFDSKGTRLGRGRGFYDRLLPLYNATRIGLCFEFQFLSSLPADPKDGPMDFLFTETQTLKFSSNC